MDIRRNGLLDPKVEFVTGDIRAPARRDIFGHVADFFMVDPWDSPELLMRHWGTIW